MVLLDLDHLMLDHPKSINARNEFEKAKLSGGL